MRVPNKKHIVRFFFLLSLFGRSHICAPAAMPSAKSMTSEGRNPPAPHSVRARPRLPPRRVPPPSPADRSGAQAGAGARSADTRPAPAVLRPLPFPDPRGRRWGAGGTQEAPGRVLLITGRSSRLVERICFSSSDTLLSTPSPSPSPRL